MTTISRKCPDKVTEYIHTSRLKAKIHYTSFSVASRWQVRNKLATSRSFSPHAVVSKSDKSPLCLL